MNKIKTNSEGLVFLGWPNTVKLEIRLKSDFLENTFFGHNYWKNARNLTKFSQKLPYNNAYLSTKGFKEENFWLIIAIFCLFFKIHDFCQLSLRNLLLSEEKSHSHRHFALKQSCIDINSTTEKQGSQQNPRKKLLSFKLKTGSKWPPPWLFEG